MDAPKCQRFPSCGKRHYGLCNPKDLPELPDDDVSLPAGSTVVAPVRAVKTNKKSAPMVEPPQQERPERKRALTQSELNKRYRAKNRDKHNAYMRVYLRAYRLRKKSVAAALASSAKE